MIGPLADDPLAFFGCYTFPGTWRPASGSRPGPAAATVLAALRAELPDAQIEHAARLRRARRRTGPVANAAAHARAADVVVAVLGDEAGMFGRGTSGEGCDATDLRLPGVQAELLELVATARPSC